MKLIITSKLLKKFVNKKNKIADSKNNLLIILIIGNINHLKFLEFHYLYHELFQMYLFPLHRNN